MNCKHLTYIAWLGRREFSGQEETFEPLISKSKLRHRFAILKFFQFFFAIFVLV